MIAHEYPGPVTSVVSYGLAAAVSAARVTGKDHFPSDVLVGSALGWFIGQEVYRHHHDPTLGGGDWETYAESQQDSPAQEPLKQMALPMLNWTAGSTRPSSGSRRSATFIRNISICGLGRASNAQILSRKRAIRFEQWRLRSDGIEQTVWRSQKRIPARSRSQRRRE